MNIHNTPKKRRFLVIARVGDDSLHRQWLHPETFRNFDLYISYYGNRSGRFKQDCEYYSETKGPRWPVYKEIVDELGERLYQYDAVWFPADDISTDSYNINKMFHIFTDLKLWLAQPALTEDSYRSWNITIRKADHIVHFTHFVEIMVPLFSPYALQICAPTFDTSFSGWGIDFIWPKLLQYPDNKIAIIDATPVRHTRPVGKGNLVNIQNGSGVQQTRREQFQNVLAQHQIVIQSQYPEGIKSISGIKLPSF